MKFRKMKKRMMMITSITSGGALMSSTFSTSKFKMIIKIYEQVMI